MVQISNQRWGEVPGLGSVDMWVLQSPGLRVEVLTLGAIIRSLSCRGKHGQMEDVVLGYDNLEGYVSDKRYLGAVVGRVANRIAKGRFVVEGKEYQLDTNNGPNALHGGLRGFSQVPQEVLLFLSTYDGELQEIGKEGKQSFWGETLTADYRARSTRTTPINLTNHSYFNLAGQVRRSELRGNAGSLFPPGSLLFFALMSLRCRTNLPPLPHRLGRI
uniref:Galactose mutarotase n=1 Tax=Cyprinodon variegatus TaxID=28743 RepID=A0A3Q2DHF8_CYPVA